MTTRRGFLRVISAGLTGSLTGLGLFSPKAAQSADAFKLTSNKSLSSQTGKPSNQSFNKITNQNKRGVSGMNSEMAGENAYRPPYLGKFRTVDKPLTVLSTLLSRADYSPLEQRRRDPQLLLDRTGKLVDDPVSVPKGLAFESDPNIGFEKWCKYWRQVHGPRFVRALEPDGIQKLLRYDQIHRIPSGPTSLDPLPYVAPVDENSELYNSVIGHIPPYRRPQWDGIAYLTFETKDHLKAVLGDKKVQEKIIPEDQAIFRELTPVITDQHIILPSQTQRDPILLIKTHQRRSGFTRAQFQEQWLHHHAELVLSKPSTHRYLKRYVQLHNVGPSSEGEPLWHRVASQIDGVTIMAFSSMNDVEDFLMSEDYYDLENDEMAICDRGKSEYWTALAHNVVNQIYPERPTSR